jgi:hypothetical protein
MGSQGGDWLVTILDAWMQQTERLAGAATEVHEFLARRLEMLKPSPAAGPKKSSSNSNHDGEIAACLLPPPSLSANPHHIPDLHWCENLKVIGVGSLIPECVIR